MPFTKHDIQKPKKGLSQRIVENKAPKIIENDKKVLIIKGPKTSNTILQLLTDTGLTKKDGYVRLLRKNEILPFENCTSLEFLAMKNDTSLIMYGSHSKKRPHNLVLGRMFSGHMLDMVEFGVENFKSLSDFQNVKFTSHINPCLIFSGDAFDGNSEYKRIQNLLIDFYRGKRTDNILLQGLEHVIAVTAMDNVIHVRGYRSTLMKSGLKTPRVELEEIGPSYDLTIRRTQLASQDLYKASLPRVRKSKAKTKKNFSKDVFGTKLGRVHMEKQDLSKLNLRNVKGLTRPREFTERDEEPKAKRSRVSEES